MISSEDDARAFVSRRCDACAVEHLDLLVRELVEENGRQNLVSRGTLRMAWQRHIADSAQLIDYVEQEPDLWLDLGSGAGFPGLVIAIMRPDWPVRLVESRARRIEWLERMIAKIGLPQCDVAGKRLEYVETVAASVISARAFAPLPRLLDLSARFSTGGTLWLLPKGRSAQQELDGLPRKRRAMFHVEPSQTDLEADIIVGKPRGKGGKDG